MNIKYIDQNILIENLSVKKYISSIFNDVSDPKRQNDVKRDENIKYKINIKKNNNKGISFLTENEGY